jgi:hypothetical protein
LWNGRSFNLNAPPKYQVKKTDTNVIAVSMKGIRPGWEQWFLLRSDAHHDNIHCRWDIEKSHLDEALARGAGIIDTGDLFCAMGGKYDRRSDKSNLRPEHQVTNYLDTLIETAADFYEPYAGNWLVMGRGNHETSILEKHETDLTQRLAAILGDRKKTTVHCLGYTGWVWFQFECHNRRDRKILWYTHGYGGGGPVTEDVIQSNRQRVYVENADIMVSGHVHRAWTQEFVRHRVNKHGRVERREGYYVKLPTYKDAYGVGTGGFETEKGMGPRPIGGYWLQFFMQNSREGIRMRVFKA